MTRAEGEVRAFLGAFRRRVIAGRLLDGSLLLIAGGVAASSLALTAGLLGLLSVDGGFWIRAGLLAYLAAAVAGLAMVLMQGAREDPVWLARQAELLRPGLEGRLGAAVWIGRDTPTRSVDYIARRCVADAAHSLRSPHPALRPAPPGLRRHAWAAVLALAGLAVAAALDPPRFAAAWGSLQGSNGRTPSVASAPALEPPRLGAAEITYDYPAYTGLAPAVTRGRGDLRAVVGTLARVEFRILGRADGVQAITADGASLHASMGRGGHSVTVEVPVDGAGGYRVALLDDSGDEATARLFRVDGGPDRPPQVRFTTPARDLEMHRPGGILRFSGEVVDDFGVERVMVRFLATSGSGESYRFRQGEHRLELGSSAEGAHRVAGELNIAELLGDASLQGGVVSYHLEAVDANDRTGPSIGLSETFLVRVPGEEVAPLSIGGLLTPVLEGRLSQRQILEDTKELHGAAATQGRPRFLERARVLAGSERELRESFADLMDEGGSASHEDEQEQEGFGAGDPEEEDPMEDLPVHRHGAQPLPYPPRVLEILYVAIGGMFRAETALQQGNTGDAMQEMQRVIEELEKARGLDRLLFRALPVEVALDPGARGAGDLDQVEEPPPTTALSPPPDPAQVLLEEIRAALQSGDLPTVDRIRAWSHRAFAIPGGLEAAQLLGEAAAGVGREHLARAAMALGVIVEHDPWLDVAPAGSPDRLADRYFDRLGVEPAGEAP